MSVLARVNKLCDAVAARLAAKFPAATVARTYAPRYDRVAMTGAYIWVFPVADRETGKLGRDSDQMGPKVAVVFAEKCTDAPDADSAEPVPVAWMDERMAAVEGVFDFLRDERDPDAWPVEGVWPETAEWVTTYDLEILSADKVFWSEIEVEYGYPT